MAGRRLDRKSGRSRWLLLRFTRNGQVLGSFERHVADEVGHLFGGIDRVAALTDGSVVVAGYLAPTSRANAVLALAHFRSDGTLNDRFGDGGVVRYSFAHHDALWMSVLAGPQGTVLAAYHVPGVEYRIVRLRPDGIPDRSFGESGAAITELDMGTEVVADRHGGLVVGGRHFDDHRPTLLRFRSDGTRELTRDLSDAGGRFDGPIVLLRDGSIGWVMSATFGWGWRFLVERLSPKGDLVGRFPEEDDSEVRRMYVTAATADKEDRIYVGLQRNGMGFLIRVRPDGTVDESFGKDAYGRVPVHVGRGSTELAAVATDSRGRILAAGVVGLERTTRLFVTRYTAGSEDL